MSRYGVPFVKGPEVKLDPHPQSCDLAGVKALAAKSTRPLAIDLFSGAGGLSYGLHLAGFDVVLAADIEKEAVETHRAHFPGASIHADLSDPKSVDAICKALKGVKVDLVAGGPPCQPYSQAAFSKVRHLQTHHGKKEDPRRDLWSAFLQVVRRVKPRAVLIENVPDMAFGRDGIVLRRLVSQLEELGYHVDTRVLSSDGYGVPQHRQRLFTVAFQTPLSFEWPKGNANDRRLLWDAISDLPEIEAGDKVEARPYGGTTTESQKYFRKGIRGKDKHLIYDHYTRAVREDDLEAFKLMTSKTKYSDLPKHLKRYRDDIFEDKYKRLDWYHLCRTITAHISQDGYWYIHPQQHRTLSVREAARVQTFPDSFRFCGFPRHAFKQIGEAVPPLLGKAVGAAVLKALQMNVKKPRPSTSLVQGALVRWIEKQTEETMLSPWLLTTSFWHRSLGQVLFARGNPAQVARGYKSLTSRWPDARSYLEDKLRAEQLRLYRKESLLATLDGVAKLLVSGEMLTAESLSKAGMSESLAHVILASAGLTDRRPATGSLVRLAERFWDRQVTADDGRGSHEMLIGRITGEDPNGTAYCALHEISARFCNAKARQCQFCPLRNLCLTANKIDGPSPGHISGGLF